MLTTEIRDRFEDASPRFRFATAVAEFAGLLRNSEHSRHTCFDEIRTVASNARFSDFREHDEFLDLIGKAESLSYRRR